MSSLSVFSNIVHAVDWNHWKLRKKDQVEGVIADGSNLFQKHKRHTEKIVVKFYVRETKANCTDRYIENRTERSILAAIRNRLHEKAKSKSQLKYNQ